MYIACVPEQQRTISLCDLISVVLHRAKHGKIFSMPVQKNSLASQQKGCTYRKIPTT